MLALCTMFVYHVDMCNCREVMFSEMDMDIVGLL